MKIEKITENKIRIIVKKEDLKDSSLDLHTIMTKAAESQGLFLELLEQAKKTCGFDTDGHKLLIEAFSSADEVMVFTFTKFEQKNASIAEKAVANRALRPKRKVAVSSNSRRVAQVDFSIYKFEDFEQYCAFCTALKNHSQVKTRGLVRSSSLYFFKNRYYLALAGFNSNHVSYSIFANLLSEFGVLCTHEPKYENRLREYGICVMKKNAISTTFKFF